MTAEKYFKAGDLGAARESLVAHLKKNPGDGGKRFFLFQVMAVQGDWEKAARHLAMVSDTHAQGPMLLGLYKTLLDCEILREAVFAGKRTPLIMGEPESWMASMIAAIKHGASGQFKEAARLRSEALENATAVGGQWNETPFEWIMDADSRIGPFLEVIIEGKYKWVPFQNISHIEWDKPAIPVHCVWNRAIITWKTEGKSVAFLPVRYPLPYSDSDPALLLGRKSDWENLPEDTFHGMGQKVFAGNQEDFSILQARETSFSLE